MRRMVEEMRGGTRPHRCGARGRGHAAVAGPRPRLQLRVGADPVRRRPRGARRGDARGARDQRRREVDAAPGDQRARAPRPWRGAAASARPSPTSPPRPAPRRGSCRFAAATCSPGSRCRTTCASRSPRIRSSVATRVAGSRDVYEVFPALEPRRNQSAGSLSGGEQQMLAFGCASAVRAAPAPHRRAVAGVGAARRAVVVARRRAAPGGGLHDGHRRAVTEHRRRHLRPRRLHREGTHPLRRSHAASSRPRDDLARAVFLGGEGG